MRKRVYRVNETPSKEGQCSALIESPKAFHPHCCHKTIQRPFKAAISALSLQADLERCSHDSKFLKKKKRIKQNERYLESVKWMPYHKLVFPPSVNNIMSGSMYGLKKDWGGGCDRRTNLSHTRGRSGEKTLQIKFFLRAAHGGSKKDKHFLVWPEKEESVWVSLQVLPCSLCN